MNPRKAIAQGLLAGVVGTAAMTAAQELSARLQSSGNGDSSETGADDSGGDPWERASAPAKVGKRVIEGVFGRQVGPESITPLTHAMHWGYGTGWGAVFGLLQADRDGSPLRRGLGFGLGVWVASYVQLVPMGLYELPWKYAPGEVATEIGYHLAYGAGVGAAWAAVGSR